MRESCLRQEGVIVLPNQSSDYIYIYTHHTAISLMTPTNILITKLAELLGFLLFDEACQEMKFFI